MRKSIRFGLSGCIVPSLVFAQAAIEHHIWQNSMLFQPLSHTAQAITGPIKLSGNQAFARPGSKMTLTFANKAKVELTSIGASWRTWDDASKDKVTAEVFRLNHDPGRLVENNTLCGTSTGGLHPVFFVFYEDFDGDLGLDVFRSKAIPKDIDSTGLCGTFRYSSGAK